MATEDNAERDALIVRLSRKPWYWRNRDIVQALDVNRNIVAAAIYRAVHEARGATPSNVKPCSCCKARLPATTEHFGVDKHTHDGLTTACKDCRNAQSRERRACKSNRSGSARRRAA